MGGSSPEASRYICFLSASFFFTGLDIILKCVVCKQPVFPSVWYTLPYRLYSNVPAEPTILGALSQNVVRDPLFFLHIWIQCNFFYLGKSVWSIFHYFLSVFFFTKTVNKIRWGGGQLNYIYFIPHFSFTNLLYCAIILCTRFLSIILESF